MDEKEKSMSFKEIYKLGYEQGKAKVIDEFAEMLKNKFGDDLPIEFEVVNPTAGSHCGPNAIGVSFYARHR